MTGRRYTGPFPLSSHPDAVLIPDPAHMTADQIARCRAMLNISGFARCVVQAMLASDKWIAADNEHQAEQDEPPASAGDKTEDNDPHHT